VSATFTSKVSVKVGKMKFGLKCTLAGKLRYCQ